MDSFAAEWRQFAASAGLTPQRAAAMPHRSVHRSRTRRPAFGEASNFFRESHVCSMHSWTPTGPSWSSTHPMRSTPTPRLPGVPHESPAGACSRSSSSSSGSPRSRPESLMTRYSMPSSDTADVLWFPTGGGKSEAFLGLVAVALFYDRLRGKSLGTSALIRFPLRMLSVQQLDRVLRLITACERVRRTATPWPRGPLRARVLRGEAQHPQHPGAGARRSVG